MSPYVYGVLAYPASQVCGFAVVVMLAAWLSRAEGLPTRRILAVLGLFASAAVTGAVLSAPSFRPTAGLRYPGAGLAVLVVLPLARRLLAGAVSLAVLGDLVAGPLAIGMGIAKVGCFLHGCCHGSPSQAPWAVAFPHHSPAWFEHLDANLIGPTVLRSLPVHPVQLYFAAWSICVGLLLLSLRGHKAYDGQLLLVLLAAHAAGWFALESFKVSRNAQVQLLMAVVSLGATAVLIIQARRGRDAVPRVSPRAARSS